MQGEIGKIQRFNLASMLTIGAGGIALTLAAEPLYAGLFGGLTIGLVAFALAVSHYRQTMVPFERLRRVSARRLKALGDYESG